MISYQICETDCWDFCVVNIRAKLFKKREVAIIRCIQTGTEIKINDFVVKNPFFRNRGIGSKLLEELFSFCKRKNIVKITGEISKIDDVERLINFYKNKGFEVIKYDIPNGNMVASISKTLNPHGEDRKE